MANLFSALKAYGLGDVVRETLSTLRRIGVRRTFGAVRSRLRDYAFDARYGTDTVGRMSLSQLDIPYDSVQQGNRYQPTGAGAFDAIMAALELPPGQVFVDFGSGKGQVLMMAACYPFGRIVGVEFSDQLCSIARSNIEKFKAKETITASIDVLHEDAARYAFTDDETVFYFFIPFDDEIFMRVLGNINDSLKRRPRSAWLVYYVSDEQRRAAIESSTFFVFEKGVMAGGYDCMIFESTPRPS
jgi:SAM-dependent methyltransferase